MDKIFEITAKEVTVQVKDERTGVARTLWMSWAKKNSSKCFVLLTGCGTLTKVMS